MYIDINEYFIKVNWLESRSSNIRSIYLNEHNIKEISKNDKSKLMFIKTYWKYGNIRRSWSLSILNMDIRRILLKLKGTKINTIKLHMRFFRI